MFPHRHRPHNTIETPNTLRDLKCKRQRTMPVLNNDATPVPLPDDNKRSQCCNSSEQPQRQQSPSATVTGSSVGTAKRRKSNDMGTDDAHPPQASLTSTHHVASTPSSTSQESNWDEKSHTKHVIAREHEVALLDPTEDIDPDKFLLKIVQAQSGLSLKVTPATSLDNFFLEVSEEQKAAYTMKVVDTVRRNDLAALQKLEQEEGQRIDCFNRFGESLLHMACRRGFEDIVKYLLDHQEIDVRIVDDNGRTPLHDACWHPSPQLAICKWIIERDPTLFLLTDNRGYTPFQYARPQHWSIWRTFLIDNCQALEGLAQADILSILQQEKQDA
jgi:ankyrin repeat protein